MDSVAVDSYIKYVDDILNDLTKCQCYDCKVVTFQAKYRDTDQESEDTCTYSSDDQSNKETKSCICKSIHSCLCKCRTGKCTNTHESCMTKAKLTQNTNCQVQGKSQDNIYAKRYQQTLHQVGKQIPCNQSLYDQICCKNHSVCNEIAFCCFV